MGTFSCRGECSQTALKIEDTSLSVSQMEVGSKFVDCPETYEGQVYLTCGSDGAEIQQSNTCKLPPSPTSSPTAHIEEAKDSSMMIIALLIILIAVVVLACSFVIFCLWKRSQAMVKETQRAGNMTQFSSNAETAESTDE